MQRKALYTLALLTLVAKTTSANLFEILYAYPSEHVADSSAGQHHLGATTKPPTVLPPAAANAFKQFAGVFTGGSISVGSSNTSLFVSVDPESPVNVFNAQNVNSPNGYLPFNSSTVSQVDAFRYSAGMLNAQGYYFQDKVCIPTSGLTTYCSVFPYLGSMNGGSSYQPFDGALGLGQGQSKYGSNFLTSLKSASNGAFNATWSYQAGPYVTNKTTLTIGGYDTTQVVGSLINNPTTTSSSWTLAAAQVLFNMTDISNLTETSNVHFDITSSYISFPNSTFGKISKTLSTIPGVTCNTTVCFYNNLCQMVQASMPHLEFKIGAKFYHVTPQNYLVDTANQQCQISFARNPVQNQINAGLPFFKGFFAVFDSANAQIGFSLTSYSLALLTDTA